MNIKGGRLLKAVEDDSLSALWATDSNSSRTNGCDEHVKTPWSQRRGAPALLVPLHLLKLESETRRITQLTPRCPPHAQSGLISRLTSRSLVTTGTTQTTGGKKNKKKKWCPLCVCMDGLCGRMRKLGVGQAAWTGRDKAGRMAAKRRRPSQ